MSLKLTSFRLFPKKVLLDQPLVNAQAAKQTTHTHTHRGRLLAQSSSKKCTCQHDGVTPIFQEQSQGTLQASAVVSKQMRRNSLLMNR